MLRNKKKVKNLWKRHLSKFQHQAAEEALLPPPLPPFKPSESDHFDPISDFIAQERLKNASMKDEDEYRAYCALPAPSEKVENLFNYWRDQEQAFPKLAKLAFNVLSIPAMSAECERVFSSCKLLITPNRNQLGVDSIEAAECLRYWYRQGLVG